VWLEVIDIPSARKIPCHGSAFGVVAFIVVWLAVIPSIAICLKRFNDLGWPTWIGYALNLVGAGFWLLSYIGVAPEGSAYRTLLIVLMSSLAAPYSSPAHS
jgi:uncharacterized membrane protein YhaH (DUF805 family)